MNFSYINKKEYSESRYLLTNIKNEFINKRIDYNLRWYISHAVRFKTLYYLFSSTTIVAPIVSGVVLLLPINESTKNILSAIVLGISTISASFLSLFNVKSRWSLYRNQAEEIKRLLVDFSINSQNEELLLKEIEENIKKTDKKWTDDLKKN